MTAWLNNCSVAWFDWMAAMFWQSAILIGIIWAADLLLRRFAWPQFRFTLWMLVFIKLLLPPGFGLPTSITSYGITSVQKLIRSEIPSPNQLPTNRTIPETSQISKTDTMPARLHAITTPLIWQAQLMIFWLAGVLALIALLCLRLRHYKMNRSQCSLPEWFPSILQECAARLSLKRAPAVAITSALKCPAVFGVFKPAVLIPHECISSMDRNQASHVLIHELMHIKRGDLPALALQLALQIFYWPNILLWLIRRPVHDLRELCCDAAVASTLRENTAAYRQTLLDIARRLVAEPTNPGLGLLGLFERPHAIIDRLRYLERPYGRQTLCKCISAVAALVLLFMVLPMSPSRAQAENQEKPSPEIVKPNTATEVQEKPSFEVISIKRVPYDYHMSGNDFKPGGRFKAHDSLKGLISIAYEIDYMRVLVGPDVSDKFTKFTWDIEATPEEGKYPLKNGLLDRHLGNLMIQSMLEDRFKLKVHQETRILPGYELVVGKGGVKLTQPKAQTRPNPAGGTPPPPPPPPLGEGSISRTTDHESPGGVGRMPGFAGIRKTSLSGFARLLTSIFSSEGDKNRIHVVDKTGLEGSYDIALSWTPATGNNPVASQNRADTVSEITIFDAIQNQLGLKLVPAKVTVPLLVIDDVQIPDAN